MRAKRNIDRRERPKIANDIGNFPPLEGAKREKFILKSADAFQEASILALKRATEDKDQTFFLASVYVVNAAFAVELYLKCLLAVESGQIPETHNLKELFNQVSRESRDKIRKRHKELASNHAVLSGARERVGIKTDLDSLLEDSQDLFTHFRYLFEGVRNRTKPIGFALDLFGQIVRNRILDLRSEWLSDESTSRAR